MNILGFWERNEGQLVATIGGILIAIIAAYLTYLLSLYQINKKEKDAYQGLLYTLHVELYWQNHHFELLKKTLYRLKITSIQNKKFVFESTPMQFDLTIIEKGLLNVIDYKYYNYELVALLTSYINQIRDINHFLDFKNASDLLNNLNDKPDIEQLIAGYFNDLNIEYINKTQPVISRIRKIIENELKNYPKEKMVFKENT